MKLRLSVHISRWTAYADVRCWIAYAIPFRHADFLEHRSAERDVLALLEEQERLWKEEFELRSGRPIINFAVALRKATTLNAPERFSRQHMNVRCRTKS